MNLWTMIDVLAESSKPSFESTVAKLYGSKDTSNFVSKEYHQTLREVGLEIVELSSVDCLRRSYATV